MRIAGVCLYRSHAFVCKGKVEVGMCRHRARQMVREEIEKRYPGVFHFWQERKPRSSADRAKFQQIEYVYDIKTFV